MIYLRELDVCWGEMRYGIIVIAFVAENRQISLNLSTVQLRFSRASCRYVPRDDVVVARVQCRHVRVSLDLRVCVSRQGGVKSQRPGWIAAQSAGIKKAVNLHSKKTCDEV